MSRSVPVFGYGSLISAASMGATLGVPMPPPRPAYLAGYLPGWLVGTGTRGLPDRHWRGPDGAVFDGVIASLGLLAVPDMPSVDGFLGGVHDVPADLLPRLHARERDYEPVACEVFTEAGERFEAVTYLQHPDAERLLGEAVAAGRAVVTQEYLDLVRDAFAVLEPDAGPGVAAPPHLPVVPLVFHEGPAPREG